MKLLPRLFLSHALVVVLTVLALFVVAELLAPAFIRHHVEEMVGLIGPAGRTLRGDLSRGMRDTFSSALVVASGVALAVAFLMAYLAARRVVQAVRLLSAGSLAIAQGHYQRRLPETGQDELAELARNFNRMALTLADTEASRTELITNVAHELRTPLSALQGYAEALRDGVLPPEHASKAILRETRAMERLASDLSLVSQVEAGTLTLQPGSVEVGSLLDAARERFGLLAEARRLQLVIQPAPPSLRVQADPERAAQVMANLLSNALNYTPAGGRVEVRAQAVPGGVMIEVQDTGPGLAADDQTRIFERFYRADLSRSRSLSAGGGSGVGLTIARGLARAMHGDVIVASTVGEGSTFTLTLPAAARRKATAHRTD